MNDRNQARDWDEVARHLVREHGADPDRLLSLGLHLNHLKWVHFDTHAALEIAGLQPPGGHVHPKLPDPNLDAPADSFDPFRRAPSAPGPAANYDARLYADYSYTGLPQTGMCPSWDAGDVTGRWASMAVEALGEHFAAGCPKTNYAVAGSQAVHAVREHFTARGQSDVTADQVIAEFRDWIRRHADSVSLANAAARRAASVSFPGPVQTRASSGQSGHGTARRQPDQSPRAASVRGRR